MGLTGWREGQAHEAKHVARAPCPLTGDMVELVLSDPNVQRVIKGLVAANGGGDEAVDTQTATARRHLQQIMATLTPNAPRMLAWFLRKVLRQMYDGVVMDESGLERVRAAVQQGKYPVLMLPTHRSYMDFLVLSYFFFAYNLPLPFIAAGEDFLNLGFISDVSTAPALSPPTLPHPLTPCALISTNLSPHEAQAIPHSPKHVVVAIHRCCANLERSS